MSLNQNSTAQLWQSFMLYRKSIPHRIGNDLFSLQVYQDGQATFNPNTQFTKWAAVEVDQFEDMNNGMQAFVLPGGLYAVFLHRGLSGDFPKTAQFIFSEWLPGSAYELDNRPHFEVLGEKYKNNHPDSEEEVWIPIKAKRN